MFAKRQYSIALSLTLLLFLPKNVSATLPAGWGMDFGARTQLINNYKRANGNVPQGALNHNGSQAVGDALGDHANASFQDYVFRLKPTIIVNDSATFKGEITTGYGRGGRFGDSSVNRFNEAVNNGNKTPATNFGNALYLHNYPSGDANMVFSQFYTELYSELATFVIGRQPHSWGLGAIYDSGEDVWDRFSTTKDGVMVKFQLGNFHITPYYFKINSLGSLTKATNSKEIGVSLLYDSTERDLAFGILFGKKKNNPENVVLTSSATSTPASANLSSASVKLTDIFLRKTWGSFTFSFEVPIISGEAGHVFSNMETTRYKSLGIITESYVKASNSWRFGVNAGYLSGEDGGTSSYDAMYLNPNYQIANLLFRYNLYGGVDLSDGTIWDSYMVNTKYASLWGEYSTDAWKWKLAFVWAVANESVSACDANCSNVYNHANNSHTPVTNTPEQKNDYGFEIDLNFDYRWNENVTVSGGSGYHFVGDYFAYNTTNSPTDLKNTYVLFFKTSVSF